MEVSPNLRAKEPRKKYGIVEYTKIDKAKIHLYRKDKTEYSMTLTPEKGSRLTTDIQRMRKNPMKVNFGAIMKHGNKIEFCAYKEEVKHNPHTVDPEIKDLSKPFLITNPKSFLVFLNGEWIKLDIDDWRRLFRIMNKIGNYFGILGRKKGKKG